MALQTPSLDQYCYMTLLKGKSILWHFSKDILTDWCFNDIMNQETGYNNINAETIEMQAMYITTQHAASVIKSQIYNNAQNSLILNCY